VGIKNFDTPPEDVGRKVETCRVRVKRIIIKLDTVRLVVSYFNTFEQYVQVQGFCKLFFKFKNFSQCQNRELRHFAGQDMLL
jgi:hypothetical protein